MRAGRLLSLLVWALTAASLHCVEFPRRFTASIATNSSWGKHLGCAGLPIVGKVYQDHNSTLWSHSIQTDGVHWHYEEVLITVPASTADPSTPEATQLTRFTWNSDTQHTSCSYSLWYYSDRQVPQFFGYPTSVLETKETIHGVECEKWSNRDKAGPYDSYWAVWYPVNAKPAYSVVLQAQYLYPPSRPHQFPVPGCSINYTFSDFTTDPISQDIFTPPTDWLTQCTDSDEGLKKYNLPDRQSGYVCVSPKTGNGFSIVLQIKPVHDVTVNIRPCTTGDSCIDGARCKDCVHFNTTALTFSPKNWSVPQTVWVTYGADGDSQFIFDSPNYYLNNTYSTQFSTCACASGKCSNNCQEYCF